jgi:hypothetical protein
MAFVKYNTTLEYATNTVEFTLYDDTGNPVNFEGTVTFNIRRIDDEANSYSVNGTVNTNTVTFTVTPPATLKGADDKLFNYDSPEYSHIYSVKSGNKVYIIGKVALLEVA